MRDVQGTLQEYGIWRHLFEELGLCQERGVNGIVAVLEGGKRSGKGSGTLVERLKRLEARQERWDSVCQGVPSLDERVQVG